MLVFGGLFFTLFALPFVRAAPTTALDAATLLQNGQAAQALNAQFQSLKATDPCNSGETACISASVAQCSKNGTWALQDCRKGLHCFALPSVRNNGTTLSCTSEKSASSLIAATGAQGNATSSSGTTTENNGTTVTVTATASASAAPRTATVTVTLNPNSTTTLPAETFTLNPAEASSLIASLTANGQFSVVSTAPPCSATSRASKAASASVASVTASATGEGDNAASEAAVPTTLILSSSFTASSTAAAAPTTIFLNASG
ncbi:hypothetical protein PLICRDRAFT_89592 [Plicaturopsis crispa FD-325 SS-3]|nr:hypothetical protein PLICRDRAFT_89592 [Plicaturopsis crispa FD-325 SS-3]